MGYGDSNHCSLPECKANLSGCFPYKIEWIVVYLVLPESIVTFAVQNWMLLGITDMYLGMRLDPCIHYYEIAQECIFHLDIYIYIETLIWRVSFTSQVILNQKSFLEFLIESCRSPMLVLSSLEHALGEPMRSTKVKYGNIVVADCSPSLNKF